MSNSPKIPDFLAIGEGIKKTCEGMPRFIVCSGLMIAFKIKDLPTLRFSRGLSEKKQHFNSNMVRLRVVIRENRKVYPELFQFQYGAIKSDKLS